ncbi:MAG: NAD(P)-binding domain-containing protein [Planctomycetes bacterium]|nr:NAD(P)-binding domain-containing protein [Planctomycetota bacterium]
MSIRSWTSALFDRSFDPETARRLPELDDEGLSNVRGLYMVGEIAGTPLIKLGINAGVAMIDRLSGELREAKNDPSIEDSSESTLDVLIVGAGSSGLGAADRCAQLGLSYVVIEQQRTAQLIRNFTKGKPLFAEPEGVELNSRLWFEECSKEELLAKWDAQIPEFGLRIREFEQVIDVRRKPNSDSFEIVTDKSKYRARRVVLAIGMAGNPRKLRVPGEVEHAERISQNVADPDEWHDKDLLVFGAGDVACEAAIVLADRGNRVTMVAPDKEFTYPKKRNIDAVAERARAGKIAMYLSHKAKEITADTVIIEHTDTGEETSVRYDHVFRCIGAELPLGFFERIGIKLERTWDRRRWITLALMFLLCFTIYAVKKPAWPFGPGHLFSVVPGWVTFMSPKILGQAVLIDPVFWYAFAYALVMTFFGLKAYRRWGVEYNDPHQKKRYISLIVVQWTLGFIIPAVVMYWVHHMVGDNMWLGKAGNYWHAFGIELAFPLYFSMFFYDVGLFYLIFGLISTFIIIPILSVFHGKRYCTWFCGCGGLAETLGDRWRHLAPKGKLSRRWEWMNFAVMIWAFGAAIFVISRLGFGIYAGGEAFNKHGWAARMIDSYGWVSDFWLAAVIPVSLYPMFGGKIWCRYWCPLAKWMQLWSKWFGRLRIVSNDKCITCGECSRYCQIGIDVMGFAKNKQEFSNKNTSCIHCGICITVCPMDVLSFDSNGTGTITAALRSRAIMPTVEGKPLGMAARSA